jgi:hypothetical protein
MAINQLFPIFLNILLPVFSLVLIGYIAGPRLQIEARSLSRLAYYILVPAFIFSQFSAAQVNASQALRMASFILVVTLAGILVSALIAWLLRAPSEMIAAYVLIAAFGNVGNFGLPIIQFKLGEAGLLPASVYFLVASTFGFTVGVSAATWLRGGGYGAIWSAFTTPGVIAVAPAFLVNYWELPVPLFVQRSIGLLAGSMAPIMLVTLGVQLAGMGRPALFDLDVTVVSLLRLLAGPAVALAIAPFWGLDEIGRGAGVIQASMPAAVLTSLIALEHDLLPEFVTTTVLASTLLSALTLTLVLAIL